MLQTLESEMSVAARPEKDPAGHARAFRISRIEEVLGQPARLPGSVREEFARRDGEVILYALADLDAELRLSRTWAILGRRRLVVLRERTDVNSQGGQPIVIADLAFSTLASVDERKGLSCAALVIRTLDPAHHVAVAGTARAPLAQSPVALELRFSRRQQRVMANFRFVLEARIGGRELPIGDADAIYAEALLAPLEEAQASVQGDEGRFGVVGRLLGYLRPYRTRLAFGMGGAVGVTAFSLLPAWITGRLIDHVIRPFEAGALGQAEALRLAWPLIAALAAAYVAKEFFAWLRHWCMSMLGEWVARDLRRDLFNHLQTLPVSYFSKKSTGGLITRASSDTDRIWDFVAVGVVEVTAALLMVAGLSIVLISLDPALGVALVLPVPVFLWAIWRNGKAREQYFLRAWRKWAGVTSVLSDVIPGIRVVKAFHQERKEISRFGDRNEAVTSDFNLIHQSWASFWPKLMLGVQAVVLAVWVFGLPRVLGGGLTAGTFVAFILYMTLFAQPIEVIGQASRILARATSSAHRIFEVLDSRPGPDAEKRASREQALGRLRGEVAFENVVFSYDGIRRAVDGVSFHVRAGEMIGLVGASGGGKSTLVHLIARFFDPTAGRIRVDGIDLSEVEIGSYRKQVGMVLQDPYLFHGTVLDNLRYGCPDATLPQVIEAAQAAHAHGFIGRLPHGYDTIVGERGHTLSGGERQRISIARAILHNPRILILDEATSAVDTATERKIQEALDRLVQGRTVFAIAHRLSTLERADRLLVVEQGRITETGTHAELLAQEGGTYRKLCTQQRNLIAPA